MGKGGRALWRECIWAVFTSFALIGNKVHTGNSLKIMLALVIVQKVDSQEKKHRWALPVIYSASIQGNSVVVGQKVNILKLQKVYHL